LFFLRLFFQVAFYALKERYDEMIPLLEKAIEEDEIDKHMIRTESCFRWFIESNNYQVNLDKLFAQS